MFGSVFVFRVVFLFCYLCGLSCGGMVLFLVAVETLFGDENC